MPKTIKEFQLDNTTGNISVEYDDNSTNKFNAADMVTAQTDPLTGGIGLLVRDRPSISLDSYSLSSVAVAATPKRSLGVRADSVSTLNTQNAWLGNDFDHIIGFAESANAANPWAQNLADTQAFIATFGASGKDIKWAVPLCTGTQPISETISGLHDAVIAQIAESIAAASISPRINVRIGWEMNLGVAYPWGFTLVSAEEYIAAFRRVAEIFRSVDPRFLIGFCVCTRKDEFYPFEERYPGDSYVDVIGVDAYLVSADKGAMTDREHAEFNFSGPCGINRVRDFAFARGKQMSIDEWGMDYDNPIYVERISEFVKSHPVSHHAYWDQNNGSYLSKLSGDQWPLAANAFVRNFGQFHIETWLLAAQPGQPLSGVINASKTIARIEVIDGDAVASMPNLIYCQPQLSGSRRITVKAYDERGISATRSVVLTWQNGRAWTPAEFGAGIVDWNSAALTARMQRHVGAVKQVTSLSGVARVAAAQSAAQRPTFVYRSGIPALSLDGGDGLVQTEIAGVPNAQSAITYAAMLYTAPDASNFTFFLSDSDANAGVRSLGINSGNLRVGGAGGFAAGSIIGADCSIVASFGAGASAACRGGVNGANPSTNTVSIGSATYTRRVVGAAANASNVIGSYYNGAIYEWFSTNAVMTSDEEAKTHGYFAWKYGTESRLPVGHAYKANPPMA